ncbi:PRTRC system ParB family protein, partial [Azotobacter beijerinckii]
PEHDFEIVAGETRWQAATDCGIEVIPALVRAMSDEEARIAAAVENIQRSDMTPIEEANAAAELLRQTGNDHEEVMRLLGWSRTKLNARILLTHASEAVAQALLAGQIKLGHAELLCPLGHADQNMVVAKIVEQGMSIAEARERLLKLTRRLDQARFDTSGCTGCAHNSSAFADLFDTSVGNGQCQNLTCWSAKVAAHLEQCLAEAKAEHGVVYRSDELPAEGYQIIATDGAKGVGHEQAAACRSCASYGAVVSARNGEEGTVTGRYCFNPTCHGERVAAYRAAVNAAAQVAPAPATLSQGAAPAAAAGAPAGQPAKDPSKPRTLRTALRKVAHKTQVQLAHRFMTATPAYGYAQAISSVVQDIGKDVAPGLADKILKAAGVPERPATAKARVAWIADLARLDAAKLLALLAKLSALALCRTVTHDDFDHSEAAMLAAEVIGRHRLDPLDVFAVDAEYLGLLTKEELLAECAAAGFDRAYEAAHGKGAFKKRVGASKVKELAQTLLAPLEGFSWEGHLPAFLKPAAPKDADAAPSGQSEAA